jgi:ketosteroid isomerase-like protein
MSAENVEIVRRVYDAVRTGDLDTANSYIHPEIEFHTYAYSPEAGVYRGKRAVRQYNESLWEQFERLEIDVEDLVDAGDRVVVMSTQHAVSKRGGEEITVQITEVWRIRDGLLAERRSYSTKAEALEAVGLRE